MVLRLGFLVFVAAAGMATALAGERDARAADADPAAADAPTPPAPAAGDGLKKFAPLKRPTLIHTDQFGISLLPGTGYRIIIPYDNDVPCEITTGIMPRRVCTRRVPTFLDAQLSFGFAAHWDVLLDLRFGLEKDLGLVRQLTVAPGIRYWVDPELHFKFFATIQMAIDTSTDDPSLSGANYGVHNSNGFMYDVMRNAGVYLQFGETISFRRALRFEVDGGAGVQVRFP